MNLRPYVYATGLVLVLAAVLLALPPRSAGQVKLAAGSFFVPLFSAEAGLQRVRNYAADKTATAHREKRNPIRLIIGATNLSVTPPGSNPMLQYVKAGFVCPQTRSVI